MQEQFTVTAEADNVLALVAGAADAAKRIRDDPARDAFHKLLRTAIHLNLHPQRIDLGKQIGFRFGPKRYPLCRVNAGKGIAFHGDRHAETLIIRTAGDHAFRLATGVLRRLSLSLALEGSKDKRQH